MTKTKPADKIRSEFALSLPSFSAPTDGFVRNLFGFNASLYLNTRLQIWYVSTISFVNLVTSYTKHKTDLKKCRERERERGRGVSELFILKRISAQKLIITALEKSMTLGRGSYMRKSS